MLDVLTIIILLLSLLLPWLSSARSSARTAVGISHLDQIGKAIHAHVASHNGYFPVGYDKDKPTIAGLSVGEKETDWAVILNDEITGDGDTFEKNNDKALLNIFICPNASYPSQGLHHYSSHPVLMPDDLFFTLHKAAQVRRASEIMCIFDGQQRLNQYSSYAIANNLDGGLLYPPNFGGVNTPVYVDGNPTMNQTINPGVNDDAVTSASLADIRWRQYNNTAANFLFTDGHAATLRMDQVKRRNVVTDEAECTYNQH
jgi:prepilin-type processing-associated H-X9-DG protein